MSGHDFDNSANETGNGRLDSPGDVLIDQLAARLRETPTPDGPDERSLAETIAALRAADQAAQTRKILTMKNMIKLAVAACVVVGILAVTLTVWDRGNLAFARVVEQVNQAKSVRFKATTTVTPAPNEKPQTIDSTITIVGNRLRQEIGGGKALALLDFAKGEMLSLQPADKVAVRVTMKNLPASAKSMNLFEQFRNMDARKAKDLGTSKVDGRDVRGFVVEQPGQSMKIFADPKTREPVRIESRMNMAGVPGMTMVMTDFTWDTKASDAELSLDVPQGYQVHSLTMDASPPTEKDVLEALKQIAQINDGRFPSSFDMKGLAEVIRVRKTASTQPDKAFEEQLMNRTMRIGRGFGFVTPSNGEDWHYAGKGAKLDERGRAVLWYKPTGAARYRVIDADLSVREVEADDLPNVPSQKMVATPSPFPTTGKTVEPSEKR